MTDTAKNKFVERFGKLLDVTDRTSAKGPYVTFKMEGTKKSGETFAIYGSCFKDDIIAEMKAAVGKTVWMKGPVDTFGEGEAKKTSFKVFYFKISTPKAAAEEPSNESVPA
jgi:hypothetical protein